MSKTSDSEVNLVEDCGQTVKRDLFFKFIKWVKFELIPKIDNS